MKIGPPQDLELRTRISMAVAALHRQADVTVDAYVEGDLVVCTLRGAAASGQPPLERDLIDVVERLTGRRVIAFLDAEEPDPRVVGQLFFLAPEDEPYPPVCTVSAEQLGDGVIVRVDGDLDRGTAPEVDREARGQIERRRGGLVLDLSRTTFMDTAAIHLMELLSALAAAAGGTLAVVLACPRGQRLLDLVPPRADLRVVGSVTEAIAGWSGTDLADTG